MHDQQDDYKLFHSVDPTKIKIPFNERFAKLTLSSNKKKKQQNEEEEEIIVDVLKKRSGASCNLLKLLDENKPSSYSINPLLRSDSSSKGESNPQQSDDDVYNNSMEKLEVSLENYMDNNDDTTLDNQIDRLSQRVSIMSMKAPVSNDEVPQEDYSVVLSSDDDSVIIISDTSKSDSEESFETTRDFKDIPSTDDTSCLSLPQQQQKDQLMAAFLNDVSQAQQQGLRQQPSVDLYSPQEELTKAKMLAAADTESMSMTSYGDETLPVTKSKANDLLVNSTLPATPSPRRESHVVNALAEDETELNTLDPLDQTHDNDDNEMQNDESLVASKTKESVVDSLIISETSSENIAVRSEEEKPKSLSIRGTLSTETEHVASHELSEPSSEEVTVSSHINISAKINIKIHVSQISSEDENVNSPVRESKSAALTSSSESQALPVPNSNGDNMTKLGAARGMGDEPKDEHFLSQAEKVLTEIYGSSWRTPQMLRTLHCSQTEVRQPISTRDTEPALPEESMLHDFSIFRKNIVKTNLDSTRLVTPKEKSKKIQRVTTEPKIKPNDCNFKTPMTNGKRNIRAARQRAPAIHLQHRFRQLIDSDSEGEQDDCVNASDDSDADETKDSKLSDHSWSQQSSSEDEEISQRGKENTSPKKRSRVKNKKSSSPNQLVYLDLTKDEVVIQSSPESSPPANHDGNFDQRLQDILRSCRPEEKSKLPATPTSNTKRKLFNPNFGMEDDGVDAKSDTPQRRMTPLTLSERLMLNNDDELVHFAGPALPPGVQIFNKPLESVKKGKPIFKISTTPKRKAQTPTSTKNTPSTPKTTTRGKKQIVKEVDALPPNSYDHKYSFLKSLDVCVSKTYCNAEALVYRENYRHKKEELAQRLYDLYNVELFENKLNVPLKWNKKLLNTAGRCLNKKRMGQRLSVVELSEKVLTSGDRLRCTLIHELCHAATWIFNGESGHGATWKNWAKKANYTFPELPKIGVCHQYDIEYKYTYKCTLCSAKSHAHSKSKKVENIRCAYCHGAIEIFLNKKDKEGNIMPTPVREATGFAKFVKDNYKQHKRPNLKHADIMKILSSEFASLKVATDS